MSSRMHAKCAAVDPAGYRQKRLLLAGRRLGCVRGENVQRQTIFAFRTAIGEWRVKGGGQQAAPLTRKP